MTYIYPLSIAIIELSRTWPLNVTCNLAVFFVIFLVRLFFQAQQQLERFLRSVQKLANKVSPDFALFC